MHVYVQSADHQPVMPCHPARARELVRTGKAVWIRHNTIRLLDRRAVDCASQPIAVGMDMGAKHVGIAAATLKRVLWWEQAELREYGTTLQTRARLRRTRRGRMRYRRPWYSPTRFVRLSGRILDKDGKFLRKATVAEIKRLLKPDQGGKPQARRLHGNTIQLLTRHKLAAQPRVFRPGKDHIAVVDADGQTIGWLHRQSDDAILRHLLSATRRHRSRPAKATWRDETTLQLLSDKARRLITEKVRPAGWVQPTVRKFGQIRRPQGWLSPTMRAKADAHVRLVRTVARWLPVTEVRVEIAQFDTQALQQADIEGEQYQQGASFGFANLREYVFARDHYTCQYCGASALRGQRVVLNVDHVIPQSKGGPTRADNLVTSCRTCNEQKSNRPVEEAFPNRASAVRRALKRGFKEASHVSVLKTAVLAELRKMGYTVRTTYGYITKRHRLDRGLPKTAQSHAIDAAVIATGGQAVRWPHQVVLSRFVAHGQYQQYDTQPMPRSANPRVGKPSLMVRAHRYRVANEVNQVSTDGRIKKRMVVRGYLPRKRTWVTGYAARLASNGGVAIADGITPGNAGILATVPCARVEILNVHTRIKLQRLCPPSQMGVEMSLLS